MKRALKIIVPILLILVVLASIAWYLLIYDSGFTQDLLLHTARFFEKKGNNTAAVQIYNLAYLQTDDNEKVAIALADHFRSTGNFTQAERTLSDAIANGGSAALYVKLCQVYVEQDKLLDAAAMLDSISDPAIKKEVEQMRPAAPVPTQEPGFYNQYITLDFKSTQDRLYVTSDGDYPSVQEDLFTEPYDLPAGESKIYAVAVDDQGLVSPLATFGYTVVGVIEEVTFQDAAVEAAVREALNAAQDTVLYTDDLWKIESFSVPAEAESYADLAGLLGLQKLTIDGAKADDLSFLPAMNKLTTLKILNTSVSAEAMDAIGKLSGLTSLTIKNCGISSITPLKGLTALTALDLSDNAIRDLDVLSSMTKLQSLYLQHNAISSIDSLKALADLKTLNISYNSISSVSVLKKCPQLQWLSLSHNKVADLSALKNLSGLTTLRAAHNAVEDASPVVGCLQLKELDLSHNKITDISGFSSLEALEKFDISYNAVTALPQWAEDCALAQLDASYNQISSVSPLERLHNLTKVNVDYNASIESLDALADCHKLVQVDAYGTLVSDVSALTAHEIIVNFNPTAIPDLEPTEP